MILLKQTGGSRPPRWVTGTARRHHRRGLLLGGVSSRRPVSGRRTRALCDRGTGDEPQRHGRKKQARDDAASVNAGSYNAVRARRNLLAIAVSKTDRSRATASMSTGLGVQDQGPARRPLSVPGRFGLPLGRRSTTSSWRTPSRPQRRRRAQRQRREPARSEGRQAQAQVAVLPTTPLAAGQGPSFLAAYRNPRPFMNPDGTEVNAFIQPATQHGPGLGGYHLFASEWRNTKKTATRTTTKKTPVSLFGRCRCPPGARRRRCQPGLPCRPSAMWTPPRHSACRCNSSRGGVHAGLPAAASSDGGTELHLCRRIFLGASDLAASAVSSTLRCAQDRG